ncbi:MAG: bifunctional tRNA (5-methylaminomethyl-2-thiouridine)(34)-methyltransferase MnmD/FAD-dependent 5-carboxymethylaminomethyl-2-thiouridine(34) oxidoreductase MnmC [Leptospiraceae bacterium]|nr:bifunctional tRNA (5-methylaminomethyl-2-thiouridine)(34)-methyltransferase MnmD/FAD-dependent 5-carboxymethylaminomethyl-2-thiouridine(34) oxidoreductase MnmC [Leptospiraceae bacterium]MCP5512599.1 bifunctional tRNA (5-methylaminomethyl-2-thiouridine)(34)-methyltransferase MnmD/FAD-dependent 5-carboxymethylaminomethyl-2-thiouridine(34) oxidoreductase MnmC [Leptospiraceae bacterium]
MSFYEISESGSIRSTIYDDIYWSGDGGYGEKKYVFLDSIQIEERWKSKASFTILELGFGAGLNFLVTVERWTQSISNHLNFLSFEKHPLPGEALETLLKNFPDLEPYSKKLIRKYKYIEKGMHVLDFPEWNVTLTLFIGDVLEELNKIETGVDVFFLDGFAPRKNPEMWSREIFTKLKSLSDNQSIFATYSTALSVIENAEKSGFLTEKKQGYESKKYMLMGYPPPNTSKPPHPYYSFKNLSKMDHDSIAIIGGGMAGVAIARSLARLGKEVTLFEAEMDIAMKSSGNPAGIFNPSLSGDPTTASTLEVAGFWNLLRILEDEISLPESEFGKDGIEIISDETERSRLLKSMETYAVSKNLIYFSEELNRFVLPQSGWIHPASFCKRIIQKYESRIHVKTETEISELKKENDRWILIDSEGSSVGNFSDVVIAGAIDSKKFQQTEWLPLREVRGQICLIDKSTLSQGPSKPVVFPNGYIIPKNGKFLVGATYDNYSISEEIRHSDTERILSNLANYIPLTEFPNTSELYARAGIRATTPDHLPVIGPIPDFDFAVENYMDLKHRGFRADNSTFPPMEYNRGLYVFTAFGSKALLLAPFLADFLAEIIIRGETHLPISILHQLIPNRFILRYIVNPTGKRRSWEKMIELMQSKGIY